MLRTFAFLVLVFAAGLPARAHADPIRDALDAVDHADFTTAFQLFRPLAEAGDAVAAYNLGILYGSGRGVDRDDVEAIKWFKRAAGQGHTGALFNLGIAYAQGQGTQRDLVHAYAYFDLASASKDIAAPRAARARDTLVSAMTPIALAQAKELASRCQADFRACE